MPAIMQAVSLDQNQQRIDIERQTAGSAISKRDVEKQNLDSKRRLMNKGVVRADAEGEASQLIKQMLRDARQKYENRPGTDDNKKGKVIWRKP